MAGSRRSSHDAAGGAAGNPGSSLNQLAAGLPSVDHALDELIGRANQVDGAADGPGAADDLRRGDRADDRADDRRDDRRPAAGSQRWRAAETRLRDAEAREQALRRELEALRRKLAEVEAHPAIAAAPPVAGRPFPWLAIACAFAAGLAAMFAVSRLALHSPAALAPEPAAAPSAPPPATAPGLEPSVTPPRPTVTPIDPLPSDPRSPSSTPASDARTAPF
jgi:hypothetical protein